MTEKIASPAYEERLRLHKLVVIGMVGVIGFPLYYIVWAYWFPQPYENLRLRLLGSAVFIPMLFARRFPPSRWFAWYFHLALTFALPFFFTFMFLMNHGSAVWGQSLLVAVLALYYFDEWIATASLIIGALLALLSCLIVSGMRIEMPMQVLSYLPILAFAAIIMFAASVDRRVHEKLDGMASALGSVAHELRTPIASIEGSAAGLEYYLPLLVDSFEKHAPTDDLERVRHRLDALKNTLARIRLETTHMNSTIDLLLTNARHPPQHRMASTFDISELITACIARYPFEAQQRNLVSVVLTNRFKVRGNRELVVMVLFNLLKNAIRAIAKAERGRITIETRSLMHENMLIFRDTGIGIKQSELPHIFRRFYSYPANESTGIGLSFCKEALAMWEATIACRSEEGRFTEFTLRFPHVKEDAAYAE
jgi:signal transduction histidine kinase